MSEINIDRNNSFTSSFRSMRILYQKNDIKLCNKEELILNKNSTELINNKVLNFSLSIALAFNFIILGLNIKKKFGKKLLKIFLRIIYHK